MVSCRRLLALTLCATALCVVSAQDVGISFDVFSAPKTAPCIASPNPVLANFTSSFGSLRPTPIYYQYAGSMPGMAAIDACRYHGSGLPSDQRGLVVLTPTHEGEVQGNLKVLATYGSCGSQTARKPLQLTVQSRDSTGTEDLGLISCPSSTTCHIYYASTSPPGTSTVTTRGRRLAQPCVYCGMKCREIVRTGIFLKLESDKTLGLCCDNCNCKFSHYTQTGRLTKRVRTYIHICQDPTCFPASATVDVAGRGKQPLSELRVGDAVLAVDPKTGRQSYSDVYAMPHRDVATKTAYLQLTDSNNRTLTLSAAHLVYTSAAPAPTLDGYTASPASSLRPGQYVWSQVSTVDASAFGPARVERVGRVYGPGLVSPFTLHGTVVVDGVLASSYATHGALSAETAHAALAPFRWLWRVWPAALKALHRKGQGDSPALVSAGFSVLSAAERVREAVSML